jgi:hypothetical protein
VSELLLELEFVKRELYSQINYGKALELDKVKLKQHLRKMEDEMQVTIETYRGLLEQQAEETDKFNKEI